MRQTARVACVVLALWCAAAWVARAAPQRAPVAPKRPDFSGSWTLVKDTITPAPGAKEPYSVFTFGDSLAIQQDATSLTIAIWRVRLDGTTTRDASGVSTKAVWDGDALVLTQTEPSTDGAPPAGHRCVLRLAADGTLAIDLTSTPVRDALLIHSVYRRT